MGLLCGLSSNTPTTHAHACTPTLRRATPPSSVTEPKSLLITKSQTASTSSSTSVVDDHRENNVEEDPAQLSETATTILQKAFKKHYSSNSEDIDSERIMELLNSSPGSKTSPVLTIKRGGRLTGQWQEFIDREQSGVDQLIRDSFAVFCRDLHDNMSHDKAISPYATTRYPRRNSTESNNRPNISSLPRGSRMFPGSKSFSNGGGGTLPRTPSKMESSPFATSARVPRGIEELEMLYAPMKNLNVPLPNARKYSGTTMPQPHPLVDWRNELQIVEDFERRRSSDDDQVGLFLQTIKLIYSCSELRYFSDQK